MKSWISVDKWADTWSKKGRYLVRTRGVLSTNEWLVSIRMRKHMLSPMQICRIIPSSRQSHLQVANNV
jgi:hypothetical protein